MAAVLDIAADPFAALFGARRGRPPAPKQPTVALLDLMTARRHISERLSDISTYSPEVADRLRQASRAIERGHLDVPHAPVHVLDQRPAGQSTYAVDVQDLFVDELAPEDAIYRACAGETVSFKVYRDNVDTVERALRPEGDPTYAMVQLLAHLAGER